MTKKTDKKQEVESKVVTPEVTPESLEADMKIKISGWVAQMLNKASELYDQEIFLPKISYKLSEF